MYLQSVGPIDIYIKAACKNETFSELCEIAALSSVLRCNIRSVCPRINFPGAMEVLNNIFTPAPPIVANYEIAILWSHVCNERLARESNNGTWSPNHFVPLISPGIHNDSNNGNQSTSLAVVSYSSVNENSRILEFFFRLLKRKRLRTMLLLKSELLSSSLLLTDVYEVKKISEMTPSNQLFQVLCKRKRMTKKNNAKFDLRRKENEVDRVE
jgi:hypothetical protein